MSACSSVHSDKSDKILTHSGNSVGLGTNGNMGKITDRDIKENRKRSSVEQFSNLYEAVGEILGVGTFASVKTYKHKESGKEFAVKIISKCDKRKRTKVYNEIEILHRCHGNDNILNLVEYFEEDGVFYLVFEKMEGGTLLTYINRPGSLSEHEASIVVGHIAAALDFLHSKGIAHRDLKPINILCPRKDDAFPVKLCDFDLAYVMPGTNTPKLYTPVGTPDYMAPEVVDLWFEKSLYYDKRCDLWSLGVVLFNMFCGYQPFEGHCEKDDCAWKRGVDCEECDDILYQSIQDGDFEFDGGVWNSVSDSAKDLIRHLLVRDPDQRYSAADVLRHRWVVVPSSHTPLTPTHITTTNNTDNHLESFPISVNSGIQEHSFIPEAPALSHGIK